MADDPLQRDAILQELARIEENARYTSTTHFIAAQHAKWLQLYLVGPLPIILGAIGAWNGLSSAGLNAVSGLFAALAGMTGGLLSLWNLGETRSKHQSAGAGFKSIEQDARRARLVKCPFLGLEAALKLVEVLGRRYNKLNETSVHTSAYAFKKAQELIGSGVYDNTVDEKQKNLPSSNKAVEE